MSPDSVLSLFAGGGVLGVVAALAVVLIRQVTAGSQVTEQQTAGWERVLAAAQGDAALARQTITGMVVEMEHQEDEITSLKKELRECRRENEQLRTQR